MYRIIHPKPNRKSPTGKILSILAATVAVLFIIMLLATAFVPSLYRFKETLSMSVFVLFLVEISIILFAVLRYVFFHEKKFTYQGQLGLYEDKISADNMTYPLHEVMKIRFIGNDIKGDFRGFVSKGMENMLILSLKNGKEHKYYFEQTKAHQLKNQKEILQNYCSAGLLSESNFENILNNTNYY